MAWLEVAKDFNDNWNFPHCLGAIDGKHVVLQCPANTGSFFFFNYKGTFSIIVLAVVDANYLFKYAHVGMQGRTFDDGVFLHSVFYNALTSGVLNVPQPSVLLGNDTPVPYVLVADDAFPLISYLIKPYAVEVPKGSLKRVFKLQAVTSTSYSRKCVWAVSLSIQNISQVTHRQTYC